DEWASYGPETEKITTSFTDGINAYIKMTEENPELLPEEFDILGYEPSEWEAEDVVRIRSHGLTRNVTNEVQRAITLRDHGEDVESVRKVLEPDWDTSVPEGLDLDDISEDILDVYNLGTQEVDFEHLADQLDSGVAVSDISMGEDSDLNEQIENESNLGSNNWVVDSEKSETGRPIMA